MGATPTIAAWSTMEMIGVELTLDGQFVIVPATMLQQVVKQQEENHVISHSLTLATPTIAAWSTMEMIGVELTLDGQFALVPATMLQQVVKQQEENHVISHSPTLAPLTIAAWSTMETIGVELTLVGEYALALVTKNKHTVDNGLLD